MGWLNLDRLWLSREDFIAEMSARRIAVSVHLIPFHELISYGQTYGWRSRDLLVVDRELRRMLPCRSPSGRGDGDVKNVIAEVRDVAARHLGVG